MNWRVRFYRWFRFKLLRQDPVCYPTGLAKVMVALLFPLEWLYNNQSRLRYFYETDTYLIRGANVRGNVFGFLSRDQAEVVTLKKDQYGKWEVMQTLDKTAPMSKRMSK